MSKKKVDLENQNIVKIKTKSGIELTIDPRIKDDTRLLFFIKQIQNKDLEPLEQNNVLFNLLAFIFGSEENVQVFLNEVAAHHDGVADASSLMTELFDMFEAMNIKNS